jgi:hypothetical protein
MRTFTSNLIIVSATVGDTTISGKALDCDISIDYFVSLNDVNQAIFVPEANLVVTGSLRINSKELASISVWVNSVIAVVSLPEPEVPSCDEVVAIAPTEQPAKVVETSAPKATKKTNNRKKAVVQMDAELVPF